MHSYVCSFDFESNKLNRTDLRTGRETTFPINGLVFQEGCCISEVKTGIVIVTGGLSSRSCDQIYSSGDFALVHLKPMQINRRNHGALGYLGYLYVAGGHTGRTYTDSCERYSHIEETWQPLSSLPTPCRNMSLVGLKDSIYSVGGENATDTLDSIYEMNLTELTWKTLTIKLPSCGRSIPCFTSSADQFFMILNKKLYAYTPAAESLCVIKALDTGAASHHSQSKYFEGTLYCPTFLGFSRKYNIGDLGEREDSLETLTSNVVL
mmetsp:Transcript_30255/g.53536  ORF Transcript_30255/g.53536 Transcript_30255/m.53536 type:complete len:265 (-) Transcript_30255:65-859(-)